MSSYSRIYDDYSRSRSSFYNSYDESLEPSSSDNCTFIPKDLKWKEPLIPKLEKYINTHYLCPKCFQFPLIDFISKEYIYYKCFCKDREKKLVQIKELFNKDAQYMTFLNNYLLINSSENSKDKIKGFKCTENHNSEKNGKFRYYCIGCRKNVCSECVIGHLSEEEKNKKHDLIVLDFQRINNYKKIEFVNNLIKEENKKNNIETSNDNISFEEICEIIPLENKVIKIKEEIKEKFDYFIEFINIIFTDYFKFPNYYHTYNIENIHRFFKNEHNFGIRVKYINQQNKNIRLFGSQFVKNNKDKLSIIIDNSIEYIKEFHQFAQNKKSVEIYLTDKNKDYGGNYYSYFNLSHIFHDCDSLYEIEFNIKGYEFDKDLSHLFDGCKSLQEIPFCISDLINWKFNNISYMFHNCFSLKKLPDISKWKTSNILNMKGLFEGCKSLISMPDISVWDTRNVKDMSYMFNCCFNLKLLPDISKWKTQNLNNLSHMFSNCPELTSIPVLSKWNINKIEDISGMFENCSSLINLDFLSKWKSTNIKNMDNLFKGCSKLKIPHLINWNIKEGTKTLNSNKKPTMNINKKTII